VSASAVARARPAFRGADLAVFPRMKRQNRLVWLKTVSKNELMEKVLVTAAKSPLTDEEITEIDAEFARRGIMIGTGGRPELDDGCPICLIERKQAERLSRGSQLH
jgi:hypothetical protein